jgi:hypothetical protein
MFEAEGAAVTAGIVGEKKKEEGEEEEKGRIVGGKGFFLDRRRGAHARGLGYRLGTLVGVVGGCDVVVGSSLMRRLEDLQRRDL